MFHVKHRGKFMKILIILLLLCSACTNINNEGYINLNKIIKIDEIEIDETKKVENNINEKILDIKLKKQETSYYCSCACVQMLLSLFDIEVTQDELAIQLNTNEITGTLDKNVAYVLNEYLFNGQPQYDNSYGYRVESLNEKTIENEQKFYDRIIQNIEDGYPTVLQFNMNSLYNDGRNVNHQGLIVGYKVENNEIKTITYIDPYDDVAGYHTYDAPLIYKAMMDSVEPAYIY